MMDAMEWSFAAFGEDTALVDFLRMCHLEPGQQLRELMVPLMRGGMAQSNIDVSALDDSQLVDDWHFYFFPNVIINNFSSGCCRPTPSSTWPRGIRCWPRRSVRAGRGPPSAAEAASAAPAGWWWTTGPSTARPSGRPNGRRSAGE